MNQTKDEQLAELMLLHRVTSAANVALQVDDFLPAVVSDIRQAQGWDKVIIGLLEVEQMNLRIVVDADTQETPIVEEPNATTPDFNLVMEMLNMEHPRMVAVSAPVYDNVPVPSAVCSTTEYETIVAMPLQCQGDMSAMMLLCHKKHREVSPAEHHVLERVCAIVTDTMNRMQAYEYARRANSFKSAFLATITHELRTPATAIIGYAQMLQRGRFGTLPQHLEEPIVQVFQASERVQKLVNELLEFSKIEAGHMQVDVSPVDVLSAVYRVVGIMQPLVEERGLELCLELDPNLPYVQGHGERLEQVLTNLLSNAVKFTDTGTITIRAEQFGDEVCVSVQDTGIGIMPEHRALIFGEYQQVTSQYTRKFGGTGLGLAISRGLVELMGGTMTLESEVQVGSTFCCHLLVAAHNNVEEQVMWAA